MGGRGMRGGDLLMYTRPVWVPHLLEGGGGGGGGGGRNHGAQWSLDASPPPPFARKTLKSENLTEKMPSVALTSALFSRGREGGGGKRPRY